MNTEPYETTIDVDALQPHPRNYNKHPIKQIERLAASLQQFGQVRPIVVQGNIIIAGHGVYQAAQHLGYTSLRVTQLPETWTEEQALAYLVADNETRRGADPDGQELATLLDELSGDFDLAALGFSEDDYSALIDELTPIGVFGFERPEHEHREESVWNKMSSETQFRKFEFGEIRVLMPNACHDELWQLLEPEEDKTALLLRVIEEGMRAVSGDH